MQKSSTTFAALIGIDWADKKHDVCLQVPGTTGFELSVLEHRPLKIRQWAESLRERFGGAPIAVCLELSQDPIVSALLEHDFFVLFPIHPASLARYRDTFVPSGAKDDPTDAQLALDMLRRHPENFQPLKPESPSMRAVRRLVEARRELVQDRVRITNRLTFVLKAYFPQVLDWFRDKHTAVFIDFLKRWPTLPSAKRARSDTLVAFFHSHNVRNPAVVAQRIQDIRAEEPLTSDVATIDTSCQIVDALLAQLSALTASIRHFDADIERRCAELPDYRLFAALPGAGKVLAARLVVAFGERRERFPDAASLQKYAGVAPVTRRSGNKHWVHWRWACPTFLRQTFVEWAAQTIPKSFWAKAFYQRQKAKGVSHNAAVRALAFKWIRVLWRCWVDRVPYDESRYLLALQKRRSPLLDFGAQSSP